MGWGGAAANDKFSRPAAGVAGLLREVKGAYREAPLECPRVRRVQILSGQPMVLPNSRLLSYYLTNWLIKMNAGLSKPQLGSRRQPAESRAAILKAAIQEFSQEGIAGARTDAIARSAKVNKALLYYYFKDKDALYGAVLDHVFSGLKKAVERQLDRDLPPRKKLLAYVGAHYDYVASNPRFPRVVQANLMWAGSKAREQFQRVAQLYLAPMLTKIAHLLQEGVAAGEFRPVDPFHFIASMVSTIVSYFTQAPMMSLVNGIDALSPENVAAHREAVLDFIAAALFTPKAARKGAKK